MPWGGLTKIEASRRVKIERSWRQNSFIQSDSYFVTAYILSDGEQAFFQDGGRA
jgi:hypothetical protein